MHTVTGDFMDSIRENFFAAVDPEPEPAPGLSAEDIDDMSLDEFGERREALGIRHQTSDFFGLGDLSGSGFPDWRETPVYEQAEPTDLDRHIEAREAAGIKTASSVFGIAPAQPRVNASPWSVT